jgi:KDO2-lipid IV(A) lauroyltransferase
VRDPIGAAAIRCALVLFRPFPLAALRRIGAGLGCAIFPVLRKERRRALENLEMVFGRDRSPEELRAIARGVFRTFGIGLFECLAYFCKPPAVRAAIATIEGREHLDRALAAGRGVVALTGHFGNFMIIGGCLADAGYDANLVVKAAKNRRVEDLFQRLRSRMGIKSIRLHPEVACTRMCLQALKRNGVLILLSDQHYRRGGVPVNFLGHACFAAPGAASLALATRAAVLPAFMIREADGRQRLVIGPPVPLAEGADKRAVVAASTQRFTDVIGEEVLRHPDHWSWMHRRWRVPRPKPPAPANAAGA